MLFHASPLSGSSCAVRVKACANARQSQCLESASDQVRLKCCNCTMHSLPYGAASETWLADLLSALWRSLRDMACGPVVCWGMRSLIDSDSDLDTS